MMNIRLISCTACMLFAIGNTMAQKADPIELNGLLSQIPIPDNSAACYGTCVTKTDTRSCHISIVNTGSAFQQLNDRIEKVMKYGMEAAMNSNTATAVPSAEQLAQMQQQALQMQGMSPQQMMQQQKNNNSAVSGAVNPAMMKLLGDAQMAASRINSITTEFGSKLLALHKSEVAMGPNCPEVQQGAYAGPTCACLKEKALTYATKRVSAENEYVQAVAGLLRTYIGQVRGQISIVDAMESKLQYGDAVSQPVFKQQVVNVQRQALAGIASLASAAERAWQDAANEYAGVMNAKNGSDAGCCGR